MTTLMKVYFDARMIDHPGIGRYIRCLLPYMAKEKDLDLFILGNREKIKKLSGIEKNIIGFDHPIYSVQEQIGYLLLKKEIAKEQKGQSQSIRNRHVGTVPVLHIPHYNIPVLAKFNLVATVHDLIHITYPEGASGKMGPAYMKFMMKRILKTASGVICVSQATKREIVNRFPSTAERHVVKTVQIRVIYEGVDDVFGKIEYRGFLDQVKRKYSLPDKFLLYVGSIRRHKNINMLLEAFGYFRKKNPAMSLVMIGRASQDIDVKRDGVIYLGELESDKELAAIYNLAHCLFNLSLYEGFGLTILEAQRCGLPIVCSDIPVHREIAGEGASFAPASYIDQIYENLYNVSFNGDMRGRLISKALENVKRFDWQVAARQTLNLYRKIADESCDSSRLADGHARRGKSPQCFLQNIPPG
jgi:glycosyltransferase involved in cell wall biosynthesis